MSGAETDWRARYFDDYTAGEVHEFGGVTVTEEELVNFAERYDPQPFHVDAEAAAASHFGGLITSGWHTCAMMMRMMVDHHISEVGSLGSPGIDEIRWLRPVRPGNVLSLRVTTLETRVSKSKPDRGLVRSQVEVLDEDRNIVMTMSSMGLFLRRPR